MHYRGQHNEAREAAAHEKMRQAVLCAFCHIVQTTGLQPMEVLGLAAAAVGAIYKDLAAMHQNSHGCPCGWEPQAETDIATLQNALAAETAPRADLRWLKVAGKA